MTKKELKAFLDEKVVQYNRTDFIANDPIQIPHLYHRKEDIEISAFLTATIAWGNRKAIIQSAQSLMQSMGESPYEFIVNATEDDLKVLSVFYYRTFQSADCFQYLKALQKVYQNDGGLASIFRSETTKRIWDHIQNARDQFFNYIDLDRTNKHFANPSKGASCKRINMFLRWMVRKDAQGVDFGIWNHISPSQLSLPLDIHTGNVGRSLGLLKRKANDQKAVIEIDSGLRKMDPEDPVKYDFALFSVGVNKEL